jgi:DNA transformation protein and related proteins
MESKPMIRREMAADHAALVATVLDLLSGFGALRQRRMFGGTYIYCDDLFIATVHDDTLYFKANESTAHEFIAKGSSAFSYRREGELATLHYYAAPKEAFGSRAAMQRWARIALAAAQQDAAKKRKRPAQKRRNKKR